MEKIKVTLDRDFMEIIPDYLSHRKEDCQKIRTFLTENRRDEIKTIGHKMAGSGGGYGFDEISKIGKEIENNYNSDAGRIESLIKRLENYLENLEISYE